MSTVAGAESSEHALLLNSAAAVHVASPRIHPPSRRQGYTFRTRKSSETTALVALLVGLETERVVEGKNHPSLVTNVAKKTESTTISQVGDYASPFILRPKQVTKHVREPTVPNLTVS